MNAVLAWLLRRRPAPAHHGWQDFEVGTYVVDPAPVEHVKYVDILPDLQPWQDALLRAYAPNVRYALNAAERRPEEALIHIHNDKRVDGLTVYGIPVRLDPRVPPGEVQVEMKPDLQFPRLYTDESWGI